MISNPSRRAILAGGAATVLAPARPALAQAFPTRPVTLIVPWTAGSSTDAAMRVIAEAAARELKQPIVVENKAGLAGVRGALEVAKASPDGYTISQMPVTVFRYPFTSKVAFDPLKDFTYILQLTGYTFGIVVQGNAPWKTLPDLVNYAKANPGKVTYGTPGTHTSLHITMLQLAEKLGVDWTHVPYKGGAETTKALLSGDVSAVADASGWGPQVQSGEFRLLATWGRERSKAFPDAPTLVELGYELTSTSPYGIGGPKGMDPKVVATLHDAFKAALADRNVLSILGKLGQEVEYMGPEEYTASVPGSMEKERVIVDKLGLRAS